MEKKILDNKALYVILSIIIAVSLWVYVASLDGNEDEQTISNIPVQFTGVEELTERGLMIVGEPPRVSVRVKALPRVLAELNNETVVATVDVSRITGATEGLLVGYTVTYPADVANSVQEVRRSPANVTITVAKYTAREIEIRGRFMGSAAEGYVAGSEEDFIFAPATLTVSGQEDLVNQIAYVRVTVTGDALTETVSGEFAYELMSNRDEVLSDLKVECSEETIFATFPILATAKVPLSLKFVDGGGATGKNVKCKIEPESITVSGDKNDVDSLNEILLGTIELAAVRDGDEFTLPIPLADELNNISGFTEAKVTIQLSGLKTKTVETSNISCIHVPEGWTAQPLTETITVEVRGTEEALESITGDSVRVVADLSEIDKTGQYTLTAKVYLDNVGSDAGILGTEYRVVVSLAR